MVDLPLREAPGEAEAVAEGAAVPPPLDTAWAESTRKKALLKLEKLDTDLKNYKGNSIKESIRFGLEVDTYACQCWFLLLTVNQLDFRNAFRGEPSEPHFYSFIFMCRRWGGILSSSSPFPVTPFLPHSCSAPFSFPPGEVMMTLGITTWTVATLATHSSATPEPETTAPAPSTSSTCVLMSSR